MIKNRLPKGNICGKSSDSGVGNNNECNLQIYSLIIPLQI